LRPGAPAIEARPVAGSERGHLIEEEELCPADTPAWRVAPHHDAAAAAEFARADEPGLGGPAAAEQRARFRIVDDTAIARKHAARVHGVDRPERIDTILQRHPVLLASGDSRLRFPALGVEPESIMAIPAHRTSFGVANPN